MGEVSSAPDTDVRLEVEAGERLRDAKFRGKRWRLPARIRWSIYLVVIGFCLYRISVFRPIPLDDGTGAFRPLLYGAFHRYVTMFATPAAAFSTWSQFCLVGLLGLAFLAVLNYLWREKLIRLPAGVGSVLCSATLFWSLLAFTLLLCRIPVLLRFELNPDETQFLAAAGKLFYDPNFFRSADCGTTGPLNVYPLMLPAIFGLSPDFASSRLIGVIVVLLSIFSLYRALRLVGNERLARLAILPVAGTFAMFRQGELVHYSSEHIPFLLVSLSIYQGAKLITGAPRHAKPNSFWIGFLASAAYFTKMQAVPIIVSIGAVSFASVFFTGSRQRSWRFLWLGLTGALVPIFCFVLVCLQGGVLRDFWRTYVRANLFYASAFNPDANLHNFAEYVTNFAEVRIYLFTVFAIVVAYLLRKRRKSISAGDASFPELLVVAVAISASALLSSLERASVYAYIAVLCMCAAPFYFVVLLRERSSRQDPVRWFGLLAVLSVGAAVYSIEKPQRYFFHYLLFLYIPLGAVVGYLVIRENGTEEHPNPADNSFKFRSPRLIEGRLAFLATALVLTLSCEVYLWTLQSPQDFDLPDARVSNEGNLIRYLTTPGSEITVWGWNSRLYLDSGRVPATRDTNTINLFQSYRGIDSPAYVPTPTSERLGSIYRKRMLRDLEANPPALFIDAVGPTSWFLHQREYWGFELIPTIKAFVDQQYVHLIDLYGQRYFMRRDLAAKREAEFNRPMPKLSCLPTAVRCVDTPITLPRELPVTRIPARSRIDIEFMPIREQLGPATIINTEKTPASFRGLRLQHLGKDRYLLLIGVGDRWAISNAFTAPRDKLAFVSIRLNDTTATLEQNGVRIQEMPLPHPFADADGPVNINSWISGLDPFSGKVQFVQIVDLDKEQSHSSKLVGKPI